MPVEKDSVLKALDEVRKSKRNFSQSVDLIFNLTDIDLKKPENRLNETVDLPHSPKKGAKIVIFATGDLATRAKSSGADQVIGREELDSFGGKKKEVKKLADSADFFIAETTIMAAVGKVLGPVLGPRGKMPTPVPPNAPIENIVSRHNRIVRIRVRDQLNVQCRIGSEEMSNEDLADNVQAVISRLEAKLPKGLRNIREIGVKTTMGSFVKIEI